MGNGHCRDRDGSGLFESWVAVGVTAVGAVAGGISSHQAAKAANKPGKTDQTTSQTPYLNDWYANDINDVLQYQRGVVARGVPQLGPNGQITYSNQLPWGHAGGDAQFAAGNAPAGGSGGVPAGYDKRPDGRIVKATPAPVGGGKKGKGTKKGAGAGGTGSGGATKAGPATVSPAINYQDPKQVFGAVAQRGLDAGNSTLQTQARAAMGNVLGASGGGGPEQTGFEGYNPVLDRLTGRLESNANSANARDLLLGFLNENSRGTVGGNTNGANAPGTSRPGGGGTGALIRYSPSGTSAAKAAMAANPAAFNQGVPDTFAGSPDSYFETETRKIMDEEANTAELESLIQSMNQDTEKGMFRDLAQLDAAAQGSGRFGGDMWKGMSADAREEALQEMLKTSSGVRMTDREARRQARLNALQGVNARDQALLGANVQREGIAASERSANAASGAAYGSAADQLALAKRGQDLQALSQLLGNEEFNLGQLGSIGGQLSSDRLGTLGMVPGLEGIGLQGLQTALGAGGGLTDIRGQNVQQSIANASNRLQQQGMNQQAAIWNAGQQQNLVNNYLGTLMNIGSMGGTSRTVGTNVVPGAGMSPSGSAAMGALGGGMAAYGAYNQYRG